MKRSIRFNEIRKSLREAFDDKCAFCGSLLGITDLGNIEHFYPKSLYPEKAYDPENLLLACNICNVSKSSKFPLDSNGEPLLLNPRVEDFSAHIRIDETGYAAPLTEKGKVTIQLLNLNRPQLVEQRKLEILKKNYFEGYETSQPNAFKVFLDSVGTIKRLNSKTVAVGATDAKYLKNMLYANVITALETYLSDTFIAKVKSSKELLRAFVETFRDFKKEKFELSEVFNRYEEIEEKAVRAMRDVIYHDLPKVNGMYRDALGIELPEMGDIYKSVFIRHDLVHRNGKTKLGDLHEITKESINDLCDLAESFVRDIQAKMERI